MGHHHHIAGPYLLRYAQESAWREDKRCVASGDQVRRVAGLALGRGNLWISQATGNGTSSRLRRFVCESEHDANHVQLLPR